MDGIIYGASTTRCDSLINIRAAGRLGETGDDSRVEARLISRHGRGMYGGVTNNNNNLFCEV